MRAARVRVPIDRKLTRLVLMSVGVTCALMTGFAGWQEASRYLDSKYAEVHAAASAFGAAASRAVAAGDRQAATLALRGIAELPGIEHVSADDLSGRVVAEVGSGARLAEDLVFDDQTPLSLLFLLQTTSISYVGPMYDNGVEVGRLQLVSSVADLWPRLFKVLETVLGASALAALIGLWVASRMKKRMTSPLHALTDMMTQIRESQSYDLVVDVESDDEIGLLATSFKVMMDDIRERDRRLLDHKRKLEDDIEERTRELVIAKNDADAANSAKSDFLATMSHEVRTPLNGLLVMTDLLATTELPDKPRRYAKIAAQSGHALLSIINDILDFSKIEAGKIDLEKIDCDPHEVVDRALALHALRAQEQRIDFAGFVDPTVPSHILGDPTRLSQILNNLVSNAIKFTNRGSVVVRLVRRDADLLFSVSDSGIGIPAGKLATIFDAFSQAEQSTARRYGGTGLGLSICKRLSIAMGAQLDVESVEGQGSTFTLTIPGVAECPAHLDAAIEKARVFLDSQGAATSSVITEKLIALGFEVTHELADARHAIIDGSKVTTFERQDLPGRLVVLTRSEAVTQSVGERRADLIATAPLCSPDWTDIVNLFSGQVLQPTGTIVARRHALANGAAMRVLVVDDSALNLEIAVAALAHFGVQAEVCSSGRDAVDRVTSSQYDLVLMDGSMPDMDGYEAVRAIRAVEGQSGTCRTRIVALTAHVLGPAADEWHASGMDGVLHKPFTMPALEAVLLDTPVDGRERAGMSAPNEETDHLLDEQTLDGLREMAQRSNPRLLARVISLFVDGCGPAIDEMSEGVGAQDGLVVAAAAHRLRSMSLNIGGQRLAACLHAVEVGAKDRALPTPSELAALRALAARTAEAIQLALESHLEHGSPSIRTC